MFGHKNILPNLIKYHILFNDKNIILIFLKFEM